MPVLLSLVESGATEDEVYAVVRLVVAILLPDNAAVVRDAACSQIHSFFRAIPSHMLQAQKMFVDGLVALKTPSTFLACCDKLGELCSVESIQVQLRRISEAGGRVTARLAAEILTRRVTICQ